jgi:peptidoglycan/LPS O-acetylase OafA/YrhL
VPPFRQVQSNEKCQSEHAPFFAVRKPSPSQSASGAVTVQATEGVTPLTGSLEQLSLAPLENGGESVRNRSLTYGGSALLDVLRFGAACTVLLSHFGHAGLSVGFPDYTAAGHLAVAVFFVLSGFVIRYVTQSRETTISKFFVDRASRIYSVAGPALVITVVCEFAAWNIRRPAVTPEPFPWHDVPLQIGANLLFQAQDWGYEINPLHNDAFWSLSFECLYYLVYGLLFFRVRGRLPLCLLLLLVAGPSIVLMFPVWLLGCLAFDTYQRLRTSRFGVYLSLFALAAMLSVLFAARVPLRNFAISTNEAHRTAWLSDLLLKVPHHHLVFANGSVPWLSRASTSFVGVGIVTAVFITCALLLLDSPRLQIPTAVGRWIRILADSTFALYLLHLPFLILIVTAMGTPIHGWWLSSLVLSLIILSCVGLTFPLDAFKRYLRLRMALLWP